MPELDPDIETVLARLDRAHRMSCSDPTDPDRVTTYSEAAATIRSVHAQVLRVQAVVAEVGDQTLTAPLHPQTVGLLHRIETALSPTTARTPEPEDG